MAHLSQEHVKYLYEKFGELKVLDDIIRHRAADDPPAPILAYPRPGTVADYEYFTGRDLDRLIDGAARRYLSLGLSTVRKPRSRDYRFVWTYLANRRITD